MKKLYSRIASLKRNEFVKVSTWSAFATLIRMVASFISIKIVSKIIGPAGIALVGQFMNSTTIIGNLSTACINQGVTKYLAEHSDKKELQKEIVSNALTITIISSSIVTILILLFKEQLGEYIFKTQEYNDILIFFALTLIFFSANLILTSIINGFKAFKKFVIINIASSVLSLLLTIPIVYYWGVNGALISYILSQTAIIGITLFFIRDEPWFLFLKKTEKIDFKVVKMLSKFSIMAFVSAIVSPYVQLFIRGHIISTLSIDDAGIWEGMNRLSSMYLALITTSISIYYLPKLSEIKDRKLLQREILKTCKITLPPLVICCIALFSCRDLIVKIVFAKEFYRMRDLFATQLVGDFFKIASWLVAFIFWAKAMAKAFIITEILFSLTNILFSYFFINHFGFVGTVYGYAVNYILYFITVITIMRKLLFDGRRYSR